jgi:hypothetical protein
LDRAPFINYPGISLLAITNMGGYGSDYDYDTKKDVVSKSAAAYNIDTNRKYDEVKKGVPPPKGKVLITNAAFPLVVAVDVTGSMKKYPGIIFEKLCMLYNEIMYFLPDPLKDSFEISFAATGDANSDTDPLQVTDFAKGKELDANIGMLVPEGGGGPGISETYEIVAYYYARKCEMPKVVPGCKPLFILISDEDYYDAASKRHVKTLIDEDCIDDIPSPVVFRELREKFDVYNLRRSYDRYDDEIIPRWQSVLGENRVLTMQDPARVVDIIIGIVASKVDRLPQSSERLRIRQTPEQASIVHDDLLRIGIAIPWHITG